MSVDIEEIFPLLLGQSYQVGLLVAERVFPNRIPQRESLPAIIYRRISGGPIRTSTKSSNVRKASFQVESWSAESQEAARVINRAVEGIETRATMVGDWWVQSLLISPDSDQDNPQIPIHADDLGLFCSFTEFVCFYKPWS